jgi:hypothetical protein
MIPDNIELEDLDKRYRFADGVGMGTALRDVYDSLTAINAGTSNLNREAVLVEEFLCTPVQSRQEIYFRSGDFTWSDSIQTEYSEPDMQHRTRAGAVVLPFEREAQLGLTWKASREITADEWMADISQFWEGGLSAKRQQLLECIGTATAARVHPGGSGSLSPGVIGGADQDWVPPTRNGVSFAADDHIDDNQADSAAGRLAALTALRDNLWEHGYYSEAGAPIIILHGPATLADIKAVSGYTARQQPFINYAPGSTTSYASLTEADVATFHGVWEPGGAWCVQIGGIPDNYFWMVKSFGRRSPANPILQWGPADVPQFILMGLDPNVGYGRTPIERLTGRLEAGFGWQRPDAGSISLIGGGGTYTDPTVT